MKLNEFIEQAILEVKAGIEQFNKVSDSATAFMPDQITFEIMVDDNGNVEDGEGNCIHKITITVPIHQGYHRNKE